MPQLRHASGQGLPCTNEGVNIGSGNADNPIAADMYRPAMPIGSYTSVGYTSCRSALAFILVECQQQRDLLHTPHVQLGPAAVV
jgi:hypothetical protein